MVALFIVSSGVVMPRVFADQFDQQINDLQKQNSQKQQDIQRLQIEATGIEDQVAKLGQQIDGLQGEINQNQARKESIEKQISDAETELAKQKKILGENIRAMYLEGQITTLEMLASSKDLSEFVDKQAYRTAIQEKITQILKSITDLKFQLRTQQDEVAKIIKEKETLQNQVQSQKSEQDRLLGLNQSERAVTDQQIKDNFAKIRDLKQQQAEENVRLFGSGGGTTGGGGYPWGNAVCIHTGQIEGSCWNYDWSVGGSVWNWQTGGYGYRNCTDWVAFKLKSNGKSVPSGLGNAKTWDDYGPSYGLSVSSTPTEGAAAVSNSGTYGHLMYVERVNDDGSIQISDYNRAGTGKYNTATLSTAVVSSLRFVRF